MNAKEDFDDLRREFEEKQLATTLPGTPRDRRGLDESVSGHDPKTPRIKKIGFFVLGSLALVGTLAILVNTVVKHDLASIIVGLIIGPLCGIRCYRYFFYAFQR